MVGVCITVLVEATTNAARHGVFLLIGGYFKGVLSLVKSVFRRSCLIGRHFERKLLRKGYAGRIGVLVQCCAATTVHRRR